MLLGKIFSKFVKLTVENICSNRFETKNIKLRIMILKGSNLNKSHNSVITYILCYVLIIMIVTKQDLLDRKIKFNVDRFLKSRVNPETYFRYFYEEPPVQKEFDYSFTQLPKVNRKFV